MIVKIILFVVTNMIYIVFATHVCTWPPNPYATT